MLNFCFWCLWVWVWVSCSCQLQANMCNIYILIHHLIHICTALLNGLSLTFAVSTWIIAVFRNWRLHSSCYFCPSTLHPQPICQIKCKVNHTLEKMAACPVCIPAPQTSLALKGPINWSAWKVMMRLEHPCVTWLPPVTCTLPDQGSENSSVRLPIPSQRLVEKQVFLSSVLSVVWGCFASICGFTITFSYF